MRATRAAHLTRSRLHYHLENFKCGPLSLYLLLLLLLLFTAIRLSHGGSSPTLVQTKIKIHKTTITTKQLQNIKKLKTTT